MIKYIKKFSLKDMKIHSKFMIGIYLLLISMTLIFIIVVYLIVYSYYKKDFLDNAELSFKQTDNFIYRLTLPLRDSADSIGSNNILQKIYKNDVPNNVIEEYKDMLVVKNILKDTYKSEQGISTRLYIDSNYTYSNQNYYFGNINTINKNLYEKIIKLNTKYYISEPYNLKVINNMNSIDAITFYKPIRNTEELIDIIAIVGVSMESKTIKNIIENASITNYGLVTLVNDENKTISHSGNIFIEHLNLKNKNNNQWEKLNINNENYYFRSKKVEGTNWTLMAFIPDYEIYSLLKKMKYSILFILIIYLLFIYKLVSKFSLSFTYRTTFLAKKMLEARKGNFNIKIENNSKDEIGMLYDSFGYLINEIENLLNEQYELGLEIKNMEFLALQSQINPHFLYNTLDIINWIALDNDAKDVVEITQKLASFYKFTLNKGKSIVLLKDELNHVKLYIDIQNYRFNSKTILNIDITEEFKEIYVPKLLLQPIVENSVVHGILEKESKFGYVNITATKNKNKIILSISDNGKGISEEYVNHIFKNYNNGYGVNNINTRIKLLYGDEYGLAFTSKVNVGTTVNISLPYNLKEN
ncbi:MAG: sensor histidine kinase [Lachnospirales bacterium]